MTRIIWVHEDCLDPQSPAFLQHPGAPAIFVFDDLVIRHRGYGLKRIGFIYDCLLEMPVTIVRGDTVREVAAFAAENRADEVISIAALCPVLTRIGEQISRSAKHRILRIDPFIRPQGRLDLKRFSRYWADAQASALVPTGAEVPKRPSSGSQSSERQKQNGRSGQQNRSHAPGRNNNRRKSKSSGGHRPTKA